MKPIAAAAAFAGFTAEAFGFFKSLAKNNNRDWFLAHKETFERACKQPFQALTIALEPPSGAAHFTRINRDIRFSKDKSPYHTHISTMLGGTFLRLSAKGLYVGAGMYMPQPPLLKRLRDAIDQDASGRQLAEIIQSLRREGYGVESHESVASAPRGYAADHPRIELLCMKDIHAGTTLEPALVANAQAVERVREASAELAPFQRWLQRHVGVTSCR